MAIKPKCIYLHTFIGITNALLNCCRKQTCNLTAIQTLFHKFHKWKHWTCGFLQGTAPESSQHALLFDFLTTLLSA